MDQAATVVYGVVVNMTNTRYFTNLAKMYSPTNITNITNIARVSSPSNIANITKVYSPIALSSQWSPLSRLLLVLTLSTLGTILNGFFVTAFFVEHTLKRLGNVFLACVGMADLMVTSGVMPVSAVVLLSGQWDTVPVCRLLQFITEASTYCYSMFFSLVALESYYKFCRSTNEYSTFLSIRIGLISIMVFVIGFLLAGMGVYLGLDYDYCQRRSYGNFYFRASTAILFHAIPFALTTYGLMSASFRIHSRAQEHNYYRRSRQYKTNSSATIMNITAYSLYFFAWLPYMIVVHEYPDTTDSNFYHCVWMGICRSIVTSFLYCCFNGSFRRAFAHLYYYCFCKTTLAGPVTGRHRRALDCRYRTGEVRVHIMHQAVNINSPQRAASSSREVQEI